MKIAFSAKNGPNPTRANRRATRPGRMGFPLNEFMAADMCQSGRSGGGGGFTHKKFPGVGWLKSNKVKLTRKVSLFFPIYGIIYLRYS